MRLTAREGEKVGADKRVAPRPGDLTRRQCIVQADGGRATTSRLLCRTLCGRRLVSRTNEDRKMVSSHSWLGIQSGLFHHFLGLIYIN